MAGKKALLVGINKFANYSQFTLNGCVNDAKDMAALYKDLLDFKTRDMTILTDAQATKANIMAKLKAMVADARAGKLGYLVFSLSSHGTQMNDTSGDEPDGKDEAFVPYDIAEKRGKWDPSHIISDDELHDLLVQLPANVLLKVYLDTCHSGSGLHGAEFGLHAPKPRYIAPPDHEFQKKTARMRGFTLKGRPRPTGHGSRRRRITCSGLAARPTKPAPTPTSAALQRCVHLLLYKVMRDTKNKLARKDVVAKMRTLMQVSSRKTRSQKATPPTAQAIVY
jgi:hypothetical protein